MYKHAHLFLLFLLIFNYTYCQTPTPTPLGTPLYLYSNELLIVDGNTLDLAGIDGANGRDGEYPGGIGGNGSNGGPAKSLFIDSPEVILRGYFNLSGGRGGNGGLGGAGDISDTSPLENGGNGGSGGNGGDAGNIVIRSCKIVFDNPTFNLNGGRGGDGGNGGCDWGDACPPYGYPEGKGGSGGSGGKGGSNGVALIPCSAILINIESLSGTAKTGDGGTGGKGGNVIDFTPVAGRGLPGRGGNGGDVLSEKYPCDCLSCIFDDCQNLIQISKGKIGNGGEGGFAVYYDENNQNCYFLLGDNGLSGKILPSSGCIDIFFNPINCITPTPTPSKTPTPTPSPTPTPTKTPTPTPTKTPTPTPTKTPTPTPTKTPTPTPTKTQTPSPTPTPSFTPTPIPTVTPLLGSSCMYPKIVQCGEIYDGSDRLGAETSDRTSCPQGEGERTATWTKITVLSNQRLIATICEGDFSDVTGIEAYETCGGQVVAYACGNCEEKVQTPATLIYDNNSLYSKDLYILFDWNAMANYPTFTFTCSSIPTPTPTP